MSKCSRRLKYASIMALAKAIGIVTKLFEPIVLSQVGSGNVMIANSFLQLDNMYTYFREHRRRRGLLVAIEP